MARDVTAEQEALRARDDLVASVSHELRTPLTSVLGYLELALDEDDLSERVRRYLETALGSGERLRDTGVGIAVEDQQRVFERFFRASEDVAGNGLGLAITADIVRAHDGELTVTSEPGVGSTFTLVLPAHADARTPR